eukprot:3613048-Prymnesium_polylepis.1
MLRNRDAAKKSDANRVVRQTAVQKRVVRPKGEPKKRGPRETGVAAGRGLQKEGGAARELPHVLTTSASASAPAHFFVGLALLRPSACRNSGCAARGAARGAAE